MHPPTNRLRPSVAANIFSDLHFWIPAIVLAIGVSLLFFVARA